MKTFAITVLGLIGTGILSLPILIPHITARPLYGDFLIPDVRCMCGHLLFYSIDETAAFDYSPGHQRRELIGSVERSDTSVIVTHHQTKKPHFRLDYASGVYHITRYKLDGSTYPSAPIEQSRNWYRIWWQQHRP